MKHIACARSCSASAASTSPPAAIVTRGRSVTNLTDKKYISTIGTNGYTASGDNQTLLSGAPRQWFVTLRRGF